MDDAATSNTRKEIHCTLRIRTMIGWPTKTFEMNFRRDAKMRPHTLLVFIPGNPGLVEWYVRSFREILFRLGPGYAVHGTANAGHAFESQLVRPKTKDANSSTCWTIDGQVKHKAAYMDQLMAEFPTQDFIFVSHSIGSYFTQKLCRSRPDILSRTKLLLHLTPFLRMGAPWPKQSFFDFGASYPRSVIRTHQPIMHLLRVLPITAVDVLLSASIADDTSRKMTVSLLRQPSFCENFFQLGLQEIREVPRRFDVASLRILTKQCPIALLAAGNDQWFPKSQADELQSLIDGGILSNACVEYEPDLKHGYVLYPETSEQIAIGFCVNKIKQIGRPRSKL